MAKPSYEDSIKRIEKIVESLEGGGLSLDESLKLFEEGTRLVTFCSKRLDEAEQKVTELTEKQDEEI
ncbi:MAG: exodeoxyribonuclease VII small subunit [Clostridiales bacterium]|jgi:exodeoxyribonuclease VII small subunit|nr:exodeoxyribonuclease VII small subunit [Clostridiales bacterium]